MRDLPVLLSGYRCTVVDPPCPKTRDDGAGGQLVVTDRNGVTQFVVSLFVKQRATAGERAPKGEEIKGTLATDPGPGVRRGHPRRAGRPADQPVSDRLPGRSVDLR